MTLRLFNTLTKTKDIFAPLDAKNVRMYVCGPTVYDFAHIGNARPVIVFDVLFRLLRHIHGDAHVTYVRNITDVDDKINARAAERGISIRTLTEETARLYEEDVAALGNLPPSATPRATEHIAQMIAIIQQLIAAGHAYAAPSSNGEGGHVLFDVSSKADYGKLSRRSLDEMIAGARVEVAPYKKNAMDFVLWKPSDAETPGWDSPWGRGRPGWHIECSAMAGEYLGETFDIHGGGIDLQFPHHENEIAQSEGAHHGQPLATVWMHNGFLQVEGEKMSKSLGNFFTIRDLLSSEKFGGRSWPGASLRFNMLKTHYTKPIDWALRSLEESDVELGNWTNALSNSKFVLDLMGARSVGLVPRPSKETIEALSDDLNTSAALMHLRELFSKYSRGDADAGIALAESCEFLGILSLNKLRAYNQYHVGSGPRLLPQQLKPRMREIQTAFANSDDSRIKQLMDELALKGVLVRPLQNGTLEYEVVLNQAGVDLLELHKLIEARNVARKTKNFAESDRIRDDLLAKGIVLKDGPDGTTWEVAP